MRKGSSETLENACVRPSNESQAPIPMPAYVREEVVGLLAQILVEDYKLFQGVTGPIVKTPSAFNRKLKLVESEEIAG